MLIYFQTKNILKLVKWPKVCLSSLLYAVSSFMNPPVQNNRSSLDRTNLTIKFHFLGGTK